MRNRRGISLGELLLTMSAATVVLTMSATLIHRVMHAQSRTRSFVDSQRSALRLSDAFRRDVHTAHSLVDSDGGLQGKLLVSLELSPGRAIEYREEDGRVERTLRQGGAVKAREAFAFPAGSRFTIDEPSPRLVRLSVAPPAESSVPGQSPRSAFDAPLWLQVEAVLGRSAAFVEDSPGEDAR